MIFFFRELWRNDSTFDAELTAKRDSLKNYEKALHSTLDRATSAGLKAVDRIARELGLENSVHGPLIGLFSFPAELSIAVEVTAGSSLFFVVVDTDEVATRIITLMNQQRAGRVTFMPLNKLRPIMGKFPSGDSDARPLISQLTFDKKFEQAMKQVRFFARDIF
jgi:structural maintenance of chromosome 3 (chondroitin sulfate proteoglycan 6)